MKTVGFPISRKENEYRRAIVPVHLKNIEHVPAFALLRTVKGCHPRIPGTGIVHFFGVLFRLRKGSKSCLDA